MGYIAQDGEWYQGSSSETNTQLKPYIKFWFMGNVYPTFEEMNAAVKAACEKLNKTIVK